MAFSLNFHFKLLFYSNFPSKWAITRPYWIKIDCDPSEEGYLFLGGWKNTFGWHEKFPPIIFRFWGSYWLFINKKINLDTKILRQGVKVTYLQALIFYWNEELFLRYTRVINFHLSFERVRLHHSSLTPSMSLITFACMN